MTLRALVSITLRFDGKAVQIAQGACFTVSNQQAQRLLNRAPGEIRAIDLPLDMPVEPLLAGWLVVYRDRAGRLAGGCDDRQHGTVEACRWIAGVWVVHLTDGQRLPLTSVRSVGQTDTEGAIVAAWTTREHGFRGEG